MNTSPNLSEEAYLNISRVSELDKYDVPNINTLIFTIYLLSKIDMRNREITITFVKSRVSRSIYNTLKDLNSLFEIIHELIHIDNRYNRRRGINKNNSDYILNHTFELSKKKLK